MHVSYVWVGEDGWVRMGCVCGYRQGMYVCNVYGSVYKCVGGVFVLIWVGGVQAWCVCVSVCVHRDVHGWVCV